MKECIEKGYSELIEQKSRFIGICLAMCNENDFQQELQDMKAMHREARHFTYAWRFQKDQQIFEKLSDDGEPHGVAGLPILSLMQKQDLMNTAVLVIRYFGGIKLGKKRLLSVYLDAARQAVDNAVFSVRVQGFCAQLIIPYAFFAVLEKWVHEAKGKIMERKFSDQITLQCWLSEDQYQALEQSPLFYNIKVVDIQKMDML